MFVELDNTIEGLVHISSMKDDRYQYHEEALALIGEHTARQYRMGQKVRVKCIGANRWKRQVDFELVEKSGRAARRPRPVHGARRRPQRKRMKRA